MSDESSNWVEELKSQYRSSESIIFLLHGNIHDIYPWQEESEITFVSFTEYLRLMLQDKKDYLLEYNLSDGFTIPVEPACDDVNYTFLMEKFEILRDRDLARFKAFIEMERMLMEKKHDVGLILQYCETLVPNKPLSSMIESDLKTLVRLLQWAKNPFLCDSNNIIILSAENISMIHERLTSSSQISIIEIPLPSDEYRHLFVEIFLQKLGFVRFEEGMTPRRFAEVCRGLSLVQMKRILRRAKQREQIVNFDLVNQRKKEILEQECQGLIEFVAPKHDFSQVGGMERLKTRLMSIAENIKSGNSSLVPMGMLFVGPMGTGKTYLAEAFAKESGLTCIKLKNFRSKWVGSTDSNLDRVLQTVKALGNVILIIDEADRALQSGGNDPTNSRVIAKLKEFMSDTSHRGKILVVMMTNRPEKIDIDLKRAGRLDEKIPFFFPEDSETCLKIFKAQVKKHKVTLDGEIDWTAFQDDLVGYSAAEIEAVLLATAKIANSESGGTDVLITTEHVQKALVEVVRSRDTRMLEYMEMQAVFESSTREMLPDHYKKMSSDEIQVRLDELRRILRGRL